MSKRDWIPEQDKKIVLIVEDDEGIGMLLEEYLLEETSFEVFLVDGTLKALEVLNRVRPNLFIVDYRLPYMTGIAFYDVVSKMPGLEHAPFILISANLPLDEIKKRPVIGIKKPFDLNKLVNTAEKLVMQKTI